jgi:DNA-binding NtrC family response regulator
MAVLLHCRTVVARSATIFNSTMGKLSATGPVTVLLISSVPESIAALERIFRLCNWRLEKAPNCREAITFARRTGTPVIICERDLQDGGWKDVLRDLDSLPSRSSLIVTSRLADSALWAEVLNLGAYDVLAQPFDPDEIYRVVLLAWDNALAPQRSFPTPNSPDLHDLSRKAH